MSTLQPQGPTSYDLNTRTLLTAVALNRAIECVAKLITKLQKSDILTRTTTKQFLKDDITVELLRAEVLFLQYEELVAQDKREDSTEEARKARVQHFWERIEELKGKSKK